MYHYISRVNYSLSFLLHSLSFVVACIGTIALKGTPNALDALVTREQVRFK